MAKYDVKYTTGSAPAGTTKSNNLAFATGAPDYSQSGWYAGVPDDGRYLFIANSTDLSLAGRSTGQGTGTMQTDQPIWWGTTDTSDAEVLRVVNKLPKRPQNYTTATQALTWARSSGYYSVYPSYSQPLITSGLVLRLNASDPASYSGSGSTWTDLAGTQQNVTLYNSPTYTSGTPAYFTFNGSTQYGLGSGSVIPTTSYTKSVWFYLNAYQDNNIVSGDGHFIFMGDTPSVDKKIYSGHSNWGNYKAYPSAATINLNTWYYAALTFNTTDGMKLYINGVLDSSYTANKGAHPGAGTINVATFNGGNLMNGRISKVYCYNTSLTGPEILQNFNADKSEFGL